MYKIEIEKVAGWDRAFNSALFTVHKDSTKEPSDAWKKRMMLAEHSPIRDVEFDIKVYDIPYYVSTHLVRHHVGVTPFVSTQRTDRTGEPREKKPQDAPVMMKMSVNAQALINMSRKRLCSKASKETRELWEAIKDKMKEIDPIVASCMVKECVYRGFCPENDSCKFTDTSTFKLQLNFYRTFDLDK